MTYEAITDQTNMNSWRVEAIDYENEGVGYIAIFAGPNAKGRAIEYMKWKNSNQTSCIAA